jgi:hypothetical protein
MNYFMNVTDLFQFRDAVSGHVNSDPEAAPVI